MKDKWKDFKVVLLVIAIGILVVSVYSAINQNNKVPKPYDDVLIPFNQDGEWGYMNRSGEIIVEPIYDYAFEFEKDLDLTVVSKDDRIGFINRFGEEVVEPKYDFCGQDLGFASSYYVDDYYYAGYYREGYDDDDEPGDDERSYLIDKNGEQVKVELFNYCHNYEANVDNEFMKYLKDIAKSKSFGQYTYDYESWSYPFINCENMYRYTQAEHVEGGYPNIKYGYMNDKGEVAIQPIYDSAEHFENKIARVRIDNKEGYIDKTGKEVIPLQYDSLGDFSEGVVYAKKDGEEMYLDKSGKVLFKVNINANDIRNTNFNDGLLPTNANSHKTNYLDKKGNIVLENIYLPEYMDETGNTYWDGNFSEGLLPIILDAKVGYIDTSGEVVIEPKFDVAWHFKNGVAKVLIDEEEGYINKQGRLIVPDEDSKDKNTLSTQEELNTDENNLKASIDKFINGTNKDLSYLRDEYLERIHDLEFRNDNLGVVAQEKNLSNGEMGNYLQEVLDDYIILLDDMNEELERELSLDKLEILEQLKKDWIVKENKAIAEFDKAVAESSGTWEVTGAPSYRIKAINEHCHDVVDRLLR